MWGRVHRLLNQPVDIALTLILIPEGKQLSPFLSKEFFILEGGGGEEFL